VNIGLSLLACGATAALAVTACGNGGGAGGGVAHPSWENGLGPGVTVLAPGSYIAGNGSPGAAVTGMVTGLESGDVSRMCGYFEPSSASSCKQALSYATWPAMADEIPRITRFSVGYTAIKGSEALAVILGNSCTARPAAAFAAGPTASCTASTDPAAGLDSGASFAALWASANSSSGTGETSLAPLVKVNGKWYVDSVP
jgi:hypothetical protein